MKKFELLLNGKVFLVEVTKVNRESALVMVNGTAYEIGINDLSQMDLPHMVKATEPQEVQSPSGQTCLVESANGSVTVKAPLPGLIIDVKVGIGSRVVPGDVLLIIETMKMENNVVAPRPGVVKTISVKKGDTVNEGVPLVVIAE